MKPISEFEQLVLLAVARRKPDAYGMLVCWDIEERTGKSVSVAAVYSALGRLEDAGLVRSFLSVPMGHRGGRAKKHFTLQRVGALALAESQEKMRRMWDGVDLSGYLEPS